ncbi:energy transducer TonB [Sulfurovum sp.]|uniref:energy transducer TonB n=1 Tax=Sulfurovum sp. TaxID=1969726 RepID=UPI0025F49A49|nr:TonB family protein [Sulfurovum sp.]
MVKHRHLISYTLTSVIYLAVFLFYAFLFKEIFVSEQKAQDHTISLSLSEFIPEAVPAPQKEPQKEEILPEPEPVVEEKQPVATPEPEPVKPKTIPKPPEAKKKTVKKKVVKKKVVKKKPVKKKQYTNKKKTRKRKVPKHTLTGVAPGAKRQGNSTRSTPAQKNRFLSQVRARINRNKSYPRIAKRRGMQGSVNVHFTILPSGNVGHIAVTGPKVFHASARKAIERSFPVNTKHIPVSLPKTVNLTLRYQLR